MRLRGFSYVQQEEIRDAFYQEWLPEGSYTAEERDGETWYVLNQDVFNADDLETARSGRRVIGLNVSEHVDFGYADWMQHAIEQWTYYKNYGKIGNDITAQMSTEDAQETSLNMTNIWTAVCIWFPDFISGRKDIDSSPDWDAYCKEINGYNPQLYCDVLNAILHPESGQ